MKLFKRAVLVILVLVVAILAGLFIYLQTLKPTLSGELHVPGLQQPVEVFFDDAGVPHIYAQNEEDGYRAMGYLHAQDRLFQMELLRRAAQGRLAEILGPDLLPVDKLFRTLGTSEFARDRVAKTLQADTTAFQRAVKAYLAGINAFVQHGETPLEFTVIGIPKTEYTAEDIYHAMGIITFGFAEGFQADPVFQKIKSELGVEYLKDLAVHTPSDAVTLPSHRGEIKTLRTDSLIAAIQQAVARMPVPLFQGSNGWAVSGEKSASGFPILANDTHMGFSQPAVWYETHLECPDFSSYGHYLPGVPVPILGNNRFCGWGLTMFENDDVDFFLETLNPENPNEVKYKGEWVILQQREEVIQVKGQSDVHLTVRTTPHGPLINGIVENIDSLAPQASIYWQLLHQQNITLESFYRLAHAASFAEAEAAVASVQSPGLNVMYADRAGNIAWWAAAQLPIRAPHVNSKLFLDGASGADEFLGYHDFTKNPQAVNPPEGFVYTANNQPDTVQGILFPGYYYPKSRAGRLVELLQADKKFTMEDMTAMQMDHTSYMHAEISHLLAGFISTEGKPAEVARLKEELEAWNGSHESTSIAPSVYYNVLSFVVYKTFADELGVPPLKALLGTSVMKNSFLILLSNENSPWWDDINSSPAEETRADIINMAVASALRELKGMGNTAEEWKWGKIHTLTHNHAFSVSPLLGRFFNVGPFEVEAGSEVLNNWDFRYDTLGTFPVLSGPALRKVTDFSRIEQGITISPTGQSGNRMSPHYSDQAERYVQGVTRTMFMNREEITAKVPKKLMLLPAED